MQVGKYRSVLSDAVVSADQWFEGRAPPRPDTNLNYGVPETDNDTEMKSYDACCPCEMSKSQLSDVHIEMGMEFQDRNGKDRTLTVNRAVHTVHPQDPKRRTYIDTDTYTRSTNKLQHFYGGVAVHLQNPTGKRKAMSAAPVQPSTVNGMPVETAYNESTPTPSLNANTVPAKSSTVDVLSNYPNVVQFTLDTMQSVPAGVPTTNTQQTGAELAITANKAFAASVNRFMPPKKP